MSRYYGKITSAAFANANSLKRCPMPHFFVPLQGESSVWYCTKCGGRLSKTDAAAYNAGALRVYKKSVIVP